MFNRSLDISKSGGTATEMEICGYRYAPHYYFAIVNTKTLTVRSELINLSTGEPTVLSGDLIKVERTAGHTFRWTALNGAYLYKVGSTNANHMESFGQNGVYNGGSNTYEACITMIASKEPLDI